ncbi:MAG: hypothetical protein ACK4OO_08235, partial [bacterium]
MKDPFSRTIKKGLWVTAGALGLLVLVVGGMWSEVPSVDELRNYEPQLSTRLLDRNGKLFTELYVQRRAPVHLSEVPR